MSESDPFNIDLDGPGIFYESLSNQKLNSNKKKNFLERMKERDTNHTRSKINSKAVQKPFKMKPPSQSKISRDNLEVSPVAKQLIKKELDRRNVEYNYFPEKQIELQFNRSFKGQQKSSKEKSPETEDNIFNRQEVSRHGN